MLRLALRRILGLSQGTRSLHRQLLLWLLLPQLVLWLAAASFTYKLADRYANQAIDAALSTASRSLARQVKPIGNGLFIDFPRAAQDIIEADPDDRVYYMVSTPPGEFILGNSQVPPASGTRPSRANSAPPSLSSRTSSLATCWAPRGLAVSHTASRSTSGALTNL